MCGIAGIYGTIPPGQRRETMAVLQQQLAHRGPDGSQTYDDAMIGLVHTRLSIIDLSANGNQPLYNETCDLVLVCNGEIYNYQQLRQELLAKGHQFSSHSDCEVILHLYEEHNGSATAVLARLTGMFAFAVWDTRNQTLLLARDRIGIKPLYYSHQGGQLLFASEVKPIASCGSQYARLDSTSIFEYFLTGSVPGPNTFFESIKSLEAGHYLTISGGKSTINQYWDIPHGLGKWQSEAAAQAATGQLLQQVVKDHLVADVPVGTFLSAGVDSSLITAIAVGHHPGIHSFTASFPGEPEDEGDIAAATALKLGTTHNAYALTANFFSDFPVQFRDIDQPFAISSALSLGRISRMAKQQVKVVLSGDGGDELFGGYGRYESPREPDFLKWIPKPIRREVLLTGAKLTGKRSLEQVWANLQISDAQRFFDKTVIAKVETALTLFPDVDIKDIDQGRYLRRLGNLFASRAGEDPLNQVLYVDMKTTLIDEMLTKCDRMTMINGIEGRVPFLDHRMVELAFSIPAAYKRQNGIGKIVLRNLLADKLGRELAYRSKTGFNNPLKQWLSADQGTIDFVKAALIGAGGLRFLNATTIAAYEREPHKHAPGLIFSLVCLNQYFNE